MKNVLIIDDSKMFRKTLARIVGESFNILGEASDGNEGFENYKSLKPNVTLLDITMPNCDGRECLKKIMDYDPHAVVVMVSGINDNDIAAECVSIGARGFINKSIVDISSTDSCREVLNQISSLVEVPREIGA